MLVLTYMRGFTGCAGGLFNQYGVSVGQYIARSIGTQAPWAHAIDASISRGLIAFCSTANHPGPHGGMPRPSIPARRRGLKGRSGGLRAWCDETEWFCAGTKRSLTTRYINTAILSCSSSSGSRGAVTIAVSEWRAVYLHSIRSVAWRWSDW